MPILLVRPYQSSVWRLIYSFLVLPVLLWLRWGCLVIPSSKQFINFTSLSELDLSKAWLQAQNSLAGAPFPLTSSGLASGTHDLDLRALTVWPKNVSVISCPDEPIANLIKVNPLWAKDTDPSGSILTLEGATDYTTVHAVTMCWTRPRVYAAASQLPQVLVYEFQNVILAKLGYDVSAR